MFRNRAFSGSLVANTVASLALVGNAVFLTQYLQLVHGLSPLTAALWSLAPSVGVAMAAPLASVLAGKIDRAYVIGAGFVLGASGYVVLTQVRAESSLAAVLTGAGLLAAGLVMVMTQVTEAVVGAVAPERAGSASAVMETCSEFGGALGIAVLGTLASDRSSELTQSGQSALQALTGGYTLAFQVAAGAVIVGIVIALAALRMPREREREPVPGSEVAVEV
jgi:DHA2 family multidrug resistance protein-like MFS transporter